MLKQNLPQICAKGGGASALHFRTLIIACVVEVCQLCYTLLEAPQRYGRWRESLYRRATGNG